MRYSTPNTIQHGTFMIRWLFKYITHVCEKYLGINNRGKGISSGQSMPESKASWLKCGGATAIEAYRICENVAKLGVLLYRDPSMRTRLKVCSFEIVWFYFFPFNSSYISELLFEFTVPTEWLWNGHPSTTRREDKKTAKRILDGRR